MKIELEEKEGYEWVEVDYDEWKEEHDANWARISIMGNAKYYLLEPMKKNYDYSSFDAEWIIDHMLTIHHQSEAYMCAKKEILRRMNRGQCA